MQITNGTATVCVEVLHEAKAGHWGFPEKAMQNPGSASQENCLNDVNHTGVCKYGLRWSLTRKYGCGNSFGSCRSFCCPGCLEVLPLLPVIALPGQHRGKDVKRNLHSNAMRSTRFAKQVQFLYVPAAVNTQLLSSANAAIGRGKKLSKVGKDESCIHSPRVPAKGNIII